MNERRYDAVAFDFFGTLAAGDVEAISGICAAVARDHELAVEPAAFAAAWSMAFFTEMAACNDGAFRCIAECERRSLRVTARAYGADIDAGPYIERLQAYCCAPPLFEEVQEVLAALDVPVCIVSNADEQELQRAVRRHDLPVAGVISSEATRSYKPDRRIFEAALRRLDVAPRRCLHVGDSMHSDVQGAAALGMPTVWLVRALRIGDLRATECRPDHVLATLRPLPNLLTAAPG